MKKISIATALALVGSALWMPVLSGQNRVQYREFELGQSLSSVSALAAVSASNARTMHVRPALLQELFWRRPYTSPALPIDPVQAMNFSFYNDQLFKIVIDYDRDRTEGLKDADMIDALSAIYGATSKAKLRAASQDETGFELARWGQLELSAEQSIVLYRVSYPPAFRLIVTATRVDAQARTAQSEALRLDDREAPQRELAREKQEADALRAAEDKARDTNKPGFRP